MAKEPTTYTGPDGITIPLNVWQEPIADLRIEIARLKSRLGTALYEREALAAENSRACEVMKAAQKCIMAGTLDRGVLKMLRETIERMETKQ